MDTNLISISGRMGSGKNTVAKMIQDITESGWKQKAFAGKLKQIASILTGISVEKFEDQEFKKSLLGEEWGVVKDNPLNSVGPFKNIKFLHLMSIREFLQKLGTDGLRDNLHENVWCNALFSDYNPIVFKIHSGSFSDENCYSHPSCCACRKPFYGFKRQFICKDCYDKNYPAYPKWIITDCRFPNELRAVKDRGGLTIRLTRNSDVQSDHISEIALDNAEFDYVIDNKEKSLEETFGDVVEMVEKIGIK